MTIITGTAGSDSLSGTVGDDVISGAGGGDYIDASPGHDAIDGGAGYDSLYVSLYSSIFSAVTAARTYTITADHISDSSGTLDTSFSNIEFVSLGTFDGYNNIFDASSFTGSSGVSLSSGSGNDRMTGSGGGDYLSPGSGANTIDGGGGLDTVSLYYGSQTASIVIDIGNAAAVSAIVIGGVAAGSITNVERVNFGGGDAADTVTGGAYDDSMYGGAGDDILHGGGGGDALSGGSGSDLLDGGTGTDSASYTDSSIGVTVDLNLQGTAQNTGGAGNDTLISIENLQGSSRSDILTGDGNANAISDYSGGSDQLFGNGGADSLYISRYGTGTATTVLLSGGADNDSVSFYGEARYSDTATLDGGDGADVIAASGLGTGTILAGSGNDQVSIDTLGGQYAITLGTGSDTLTLAGTSGGFRAAAAITVSDFTTGAGGDSLGLADWLSGGALTNVVAGSNLFFDGHLRLLQSGTSTLLQVDRDGGGDAYATLITFQNTSATAFKAVNLGGYSPTDEVNIVTGTDNGETFYGSFGKDNISAAGGSDTIYASPGHDVIDGGAGNDYLYVSPYNSPLPPTTEARTYTITADRLSDSSGTLDTSFSNIETMSLATSDNYNNSFDASGFNGSGGVYLSSGSGNDRMTGSAGDDYLSPGSGANIIDGGGGFDTASLYYGSQTAGITIDIGNTTAVNSIIIGGAAAGSITNVERLTFDGGSGADTVTGGASYDSIFGGAGDDVLRGGGGSDSLRGGAGSDLLDGGDGTDGASYADASVGVTVDLNLQGGAQNTGGAGNDILISIDNLLGSSFSDTLTGDGNANAISDYSGGSDQLFGNGGADSLYISRYGTGTATTVLLSGGADNDSVSFSGDSRYSDMATLDGGDGADIIAARGLGTGTILAGSGNDQVSIDTLGGQYAITLGAGSDTLTLAGTSGGFRAAAAITVSDFTTGAGGDSLGLADWLSGGALTNVVAGSNLFVDGHLRLLQSGTSTLLQVDRDGGGDAYATLITFQNTSATAFKAVNLGGYSPTDEVNIVTGTDNGETFYGSFGKDNISAAGGYDYIYASPGRDVVDGGTGYDYLYAYLGSQVFSPPTGARIYTITADRVSDSSGALDTSFSNIETVSLSTNDSYANSFDASGFTGMGGVSLSSGSGNDRMTGSAGDDYLSPGLGANIIDGGGGFDTASLYYTSQTAGITIDIGNTTAVSSIMIGGGAAGSITNVERLYFDGGSGADTVTGGASYDSLTGGAGDDVLRGGDGDDSFDGGAGSDVLDGGAGTDTAHYFHSASGIIVDLNLQGTAQNTGGSGNDTLISIENLDGSAFSDTLTGNGNANAISDYNGGSDQFFGNGGADSLYVSRYGSGAATTVLLSGGADNDSVSFYGDVRYSDTATLDGGDGADYIVSQGLGTGTILAGSGNDQVSIDTLGGQYAIALGAGFDTLTLAGTSGGFRAAAAITVSDFTTGSNGDAVILNEWLSGGALTNYALSTNPFGDGHLRLLQSGTSTLLQADRNGGGDAYATLATFQNTSASAFTAANFGGYLPVVGLTEIIGTDAADTLTGTSADEIIKGFGGDDVITGGTGNDFIDGGAGVDIASYGNAPAAVRVSLAQTTQQNTGAAGLDTLTDIEKLIGSAFDDVLSGNAGTNSLTGGAGNDILAGGLGNDVLDGGTGIDTATYADAMAAVKITLSVTSAQDTLAAGSDTLTGIENLIGSAFNDALSGWEGTNVIDGAAGDDTLIGGNGDDTLIGGDGKDILFSDAGNDALFGGAQDDYLDGNVGNDIITGGNGNDRVVGGDGIDTASYADMAAGVQVSLALTTQQNTISAGLDTLTGIENLTGSGFDDKLTGDSGNNVLAGVAGNDVLAGGLGDDILDGGLGSDTATYASATAGVTVSLATITAQATGGAGNDWLAGIENLVGSDFGDVLTGDGAANRIEGGAGIDTLNGGDGDDMLIGGAGADVMSGGVGNDSFTISAATDVAAGERYIGGAGTDTIVITATAAVDLSAAVIDPDVEQISGGTAGVSLTAAQLDGFSNIATGVITLTSAGIADLTGAAVATTTFNLNAGGNTLILATAPMIPVPSDPPVIITGPTGYIVNGGAGIDIVTGSSFDDQIRGGDGDDIIAGGAGNDMLWGGAGIDTVSYADATAAVHVAIGLTDPFLPQVTGGSGTDFIQEFENVVGSAFDDVITARPGGVAHGGAGADTINVGPEILLVFSGGSVATPSTSKLFGDAGDDVLVGHASIDILDGGADSDTLHGGNSSDTLIGGSGNDFLYSDDTDGASDSYDGGADFDIAVYANNSAGVTINLSIAGAQNSGSEGMDTLSNIEGVIGGSGNDKLTGNAGANSLSGGAGDDIIVGGLGNDMLAGGTGIDTAAYTDAASGVRVSLAIATAQNTLAAGSDTLSGIENLTGSTFADLLTGDGNANVLRGGGGNDTIDGGDGNDILVGGAGSDKLTGGNGVDTASYDDAAIGVTVSLAITTLQNTLGSGNDTLAGFENLSGSAYDDRLTGDAADNVLTGGAGNDVLNGGLGNNILNGGSGIDIASYVGATSGVKVLLTNTAPQSTLGAGRDQLISIEGVEGSSFADNLAGSAADEIFYGRDGNDTITGGDGNDTLLGGLGSDKLTGGNGIDTASYADATAAVTVDLTITVLQKTLGGGNDTLVGVENLIGSNYKDILIGDAGANNIAGGIGNDIITGGLGDDVLDGGAGIDTVSYAGAAAGVAVSLGLAGIQSTLSAGSDIVAGFENLTGSAFADLLAGDGGANRIDAGAGNDHVDGAAGDDILLGSLGDDVLIGGDGIDTLSYEDATSAIVLSLALGTAQATGWGGLDTASGFENLTGSAYADMLTGDDLANILSGGSGNDVMKGGLGNDTLLGGSGADLLTGGAGSDTYTGGTSGDRFILTSAADSAIGQGDIISDFKHAEKDKVDLSQAYGGTFSFLGASAFTGHAGEVHYGASGADLIVSGDIDGDGVADFEIKLIGIAALEAADFLL